MKAPCGREKNAARERSGAYQSREWIMRTFAPNATRTQPRVSSCLAPSSTLTSVTNHQARFVHSADDKLSRLVPFGEDALIEEEAILDSKRPAFVQNVHLIVTIFGREFASAEASRGAIEAGDLGSATDVRCLDIRRFPVSTSEVYRPAAPRHE